jgi:hypothetical protein
VPALWLKNKELIAFSADGYGRKTWQLPPDWEEVKRVTISEITMAGNQKLADLTVDGRTLALSLRAGQAVSIIPARS